jgi:hypothetical protein
MVRVVYQAMTSEDCNTLRQRVTIAIERKIREVALLQSVRVGEKNEQGGELECTPRRQTSQYGDSGSTGHRNQHR